MLLLFKKHCGLVAAKPQCKRERSKCHYWSLFMMSKERQTSLFKKKTELKWGIIHSLGVLSICRASLFCLILPAEVVHMYLFVPIVISYLCVSMTINEQFNSSSERGSNWPFPMICLCLYPYVFVNYILGNTLGD